jgi:peptidyl-prolyl cis-trans isomerase A (cyclophilin A)
MLALLAAVLALIPGLGSAEPPADLELPPRLPEGWYARIDTSMGTIVIQLLPDQAPQSVAHFAALAEARMEWTDPLTGEVHRNHFYDGNRIHKAEAGARFEAGSPNGTGRGGPLLWVPPEEMLGPVNFDVAGRIGMTRAPGRKLSAHQFFVTASAQPFLSGRHPCFGVVVTGRDVTMNISMVKTYSNGRPVEPVIIEKIRIFSIGDPPPLPEPAEFVPTPGELKVTAPEPED